MDFYTNHLEEILEIIIYFFCLYILINTKITLKKPIFILFWISIIIIFVNNLTIRNIYAQFLIYTSASLIYFFIIKERYDQKLFNYLKLLTLIVIFIDGLTITMMRNNEFAISSKRSSPLIEFYDGIFDIIDFVLISIIFSMTVYNNYKQYKLKKSLKNLRFE